MRIVLGIAIVISGLSPIDSNTGDSAKALSPVDAVKRINEKVAVEMLVRATKDRLEKRGEIYLDSEVDFHDPQNLGVVITRKGASEFKKNKIDDPAVYFKDKTVRVVGVVILKEKRPRIEVDEPKQIQIVQPARNRSRVGMATVVVAFFALVRPASAAELVEWLDPCRVRSRS